MTKNAADVTYLRPPIYDYLKPCVHVVNTALNYAVQPKNMLQFSRGL